VRSTSTRTTGKYYLEISCGTFAGTDSGVGICNATAVLTTFGTNSNNAALAYSSGSIWNNGGSTGKSLGGLGGGTHTVCVALDCGNAKVWFRADGGTWDNTIGDDPATNTGGFSISGWATANTTPVYGVFTANANADSVTANFGATAFGFTVPSGFSAFLLTNTYSDSVAESISLADTVTPNRNVTASIAEISSYADSWRAKGPVAASVIESMTMLDHPNSQRVINGIIAETMTWLDDPLVQSSTLWPTYVSYDRYGNKLIRPKHLMNGPIKG
jgi:hypothetical protein